MPDTLHTPAASKDQIEAAFSTALDDIRAALHKLAAALGKTARPSEMTDAMRSAHDMIEDFAPYIAASDAAEEENNRLASEERRDLYRNSPVVL